MFWVLLWIVLVLLAAAFFALLGRHLWRKAKALTHELSQASDRFAAVSASLSDLSERSQQASTHRGPGRSS
jgi:hypothetical protein